MHSRAAVRVAIEVTPGDLVEAETRLGVMEAMKMELVLRSDLRGRVESVHAALGAQVPIGAVLFEIIPT